MVSTALMGPMELLMILMMGGGVPVVMPPLEADMGMMSVAPEECLYYTSWYGVTDPVAGSSNSTEALMAEPQVQQFMRAVMTSFESVLTNENAPGEMREGAAVFLPLIKDLYQRPVTVYMSGIEMPNGFMAPPSMDGAIVVHCGNRRESLLAGLQKLEALFAASTNVQINEIDRAGTKFRKFMLPPDVPEIGWGISGDYLVLSVGDSAFENVMQRISAKRGPPQWLQDVHASLNVERPGYVNYVNIAKAMETVNLLMPLGGGGDEFQQVTQALGLNSIRHIATVQGYDEQSVASKTQIATIGPPHGALELLIGEPLSLADLENIPADANLAFVLKMDMEKKISQLLSLARGIDPNSADMLEQGISELGRELGMDIREDLFAPLGDVVRVYNSPAQGGLLITGLTLVADVEDSSRMQATHEKMLAMMRESFDNYGDEVGLRSYDFAGQTIYYMTLGREAPVAPAWCLTDQQLVFGLYPQSIKAFLQEDGAGERLAQNANIQAMFASGSAPYMVSYQDTQDVMRTLYPFVQVFAPMISEELRREGIDFDAAAIPSANAILPHLTPAVTNCSATNEGLVLETHQAVPGMSSAPGLMLAGALLVGVDERSFELGPQYPEARNNLRELAIAMHNYHDSYKRLPAAVNADANGKPLLSWRVHILPYLDQQALYEQFHLDEPWDSDHNRQLIAQMPEVFESPGGSELGEGMTSFLVPTGDETIFPVGAGGPGKGLSLASIQDGTSNTVLIVEAAPDYAVTWTKPEDLSFDADDPAAGLVGHRFGGFLAAFADAHVTFVQESVSDMTLRATFTRNGGEVIDYFELEGDGAGPFEAVGPQIKDQVPLHVHGGIR